MYIVTTYNPSSDQEVESKVTRCVRKILRVRKDWDLMTSEGLTRRTSQFTLGLYPSKELVVLVDE